MYYLRFGLYPLTFNIILYFSESKLLLIFQHNYYSRQTIKNGNNRYEEEQCS